MQTFTKAEVVDELRALVAKSSTAKAGAELGVVPQLISMVILGQREISDGLALKLGFIKLPDKYMRAPTSAE